MNGKAADLPFIDEHAVEVDAPPETVWPAILSVISRSFSGRAQTAFARALGCADRVAQGPIAAVGSTIPGFRVAEAQERSLLALEGRHRFSRYALTFRIDELDNDRSRVRAETRAEFPGAKGRVYRGLVIGTRGHVLIVRGILRAVMGRAERS